MGHKQSWYAFKGQDQSRILKKLQLQATCQYENFPDSPIVGAYLPTGYYIIITTHFDALSPETEDKIINNFDVIVGQAFENINVSSLSHWVKGKMSWFINHNGSEKGCHHIETEGNLPAAFHSIHKKMLEKLAIYGNADPDVDWMFEVPVELGLTLVGYHYAKSTPDIGEKSFEVLVQSKAPESFWSKIVKLVKAKAL